MTLQGWEPLPAPTPLAVCSCQAPHTQPWTVRIHWDLGSEPSRVEVKILAQEQLHVCRFDPQPLNSAVSRASAGLWPRQPHLQASHSAPLAPEEMCATTCHPQAAPPCSHGHRSSPGTLLVLFAPVLGRCPLSACMKCPQQSQKQ